MSSYIRGRKSRFRTVGFEEGKAEGGCMKRLEEGICGMD